MDGEIGHTLSPEMLDKWPFDVINECIENEFFGFPPDLDTKYAFYECLRRLGDEEYFILPCQGNQECVIFGEMVNPVTMEIHVLSKDRTMGLYIEGRKLIDWIWQNTDIQKITARTDSPGFAALGRRMGAVLEGTIPLGSRLGTTVYIWGIYRPRNYDVRGRQRQRASPKPDLGPVPQSRHAG